MIATEALTAKVIEFAEGGPCPCASGRTVADCQCKNRRFVPAPVDTGPCGIITGLCVPGCYAQATNDCRPPLSSDHARTLSDGSTRIVPPSSRGRKVLCGRHNSALSPLDDVGRRFVRALQPRFEISTQQTHILFNGFDVERWMLKVLCTMAHGERASRVQMPHRGRLQDRLLRVLGDCPGDRLGPLEVHPV